MQDQLCYQPMDEEAGLWMCGFMMWYDVVVVCNDFGLCGSCGWFRGCYVISCPSGRDGNKQVQ